MDFESLKWLSSLGVGGAVAVVVFHAYRRDFLRERADSEARRDRAERREDRLLAVLERNATASERLAASVDTFAIVVTKLSDQHDAQNLQMAQLAHDVKNLLARRVVP